MLDDVISIPQHKYKKDHTAKYVDVVVGEATASLPPLL